MCNYGEQYQNALLFAKEQVKRDVGNILVVLSYKHV